MASSDPTVQDIKDYLGISVVTYDTQITAIHAAWVASLNTRILPQFLDVATYDGDLELGKTLCIAGQVKNQLGSAASSTGLSGDFTIGNYSERNASATAASIIGAKNPLFEQGLAILKPYMQTSTVLSLTDIPESSTQDYYAEFQVARYDSDGNAIDPGTMGVF